MSKFCFKLAGIPIGIEAAFDSTRDFCKGYLTEEAPLLSVTVKQLDIDKMRDLDRKTDLVEGRTPIAHTDSYLETLALAHVVLEKLIDCGVLLVHGAVIAVDGKAYLFTAKSGTGKTTHCRLWLKNIPNCHILNGDKPLLLFRDGNVYACGSPWMGKEQYGVNEILPLAAVCLLERDESNHIKEIPLKDGFPLLMNQFHIPDDRGKVLSALNFIKQLSSVKIYRFSCNMQDEAALVSYHGMVKE